MPSLAGLKRRIRRVVSPLPIDQFMDQVHGWTSYEQLEFLTRQVKALPDPSIIIEVGVWHGRSALAMAEACRGTGKHVYAIDPWLTYTSLEGTDYDGEQIVKNSGLKTFDEVYETFLNHITNFRLTDYLTPIRATGVAAAHEWNRDRPRLVFIDANHTYEGVTGDLEAWRPLTNLICGDDWDFRDGDIRSVEKAVADFVFRHPEWRLSLPRENTWQLVLRNL